MAIYWPSILLFLAGGLIGLYCNCRRRKQRREMEEYREREVRRRLAQEQLQHQQFILNFPDLVGVERLRQERLAHLLVSGMVLQTSRDEFMADFGVDNPLSVMTSCAICLADYTHGEPIQCSKNCQHVFHAECIMDWLVKHQDCPCCRTPFGDTEQEVQESAAPDLSTAATPTTTATTTTPPTTTASPEIPL